MKVDVAESYRRFAARCEEYYPTPKDNEDKITESFLRWSCRSSKIVKTGMTAKQTTTPLQANNVVPPAGTFAP